jgi:hypothetical protein
MKLSCNVSASSFTTRGFLNCDSNLPRTTLPRKGRFKYILFDIIKKKSCSYRNGPHQRTFSEQTRDHHKHWVDVRDCVRAGSAVVAPGVEFFHQQIKSSVTKHYEGLGGACNMNVGAVVSESMLSPHNHVLNLGLPAFLQCRTYLASRATAVFLVMWGARMSAVVVGQFSWLYCARTQVHMSARLFFTICLFSFTRSTTLLSWRWSMWRSQLR